MLPGVLPTGRQLGVGSYGSVEELEVNGLMCAGKRLHEVLLEQGSAGADDIARKYLLECQVLKNQNCCSRVVVLPTSFYITVAD